MRKCLVAMMVTIIALIAITGFAPAKAEARSYAAKAVSKANRWAYNRYATALYIESNCYPAGDHRADCQIVITKRSSSCSVNVTVTGSYYRVRPYDSTC
jgi:hypothetical protein